MTLLTMDEVVARYPGPIQSVARRNQWRNLGLLALAEVLGMSLWFSASAVSPALQEAWGLSVAGSAWLTMAVQIGFVAGTALSGVLNLPDIVSSRRLFVVSAWLGAAANAGFALFATGLESGLVLRFLTGFFIAGVYPPGMKLAATWTRRHLGLAIGLVVGALTVGSAAPHLVRSLSHQAVGGAASDWTARRPGLVGPRRRGGADRGPVLPGRSLCRRRRPLQPALRPLHLHPAGPAAGQLRLPRPPVGAVRHVDVGAPLPGGEGGRQAAAPLRSRPCSLLPSSPAAGSAASPAAPAPTAWAARRRRAPP